MPLQTPQQYMDKWNGKSIDFDGYYGDQCMDNFLQYNQDVVGAPRVWGNAIDVPNTYPKDFYDYIVNNPDDPNQVPIKGDVPIFGYPYGKYIDDAGQVQYAGHICICFAAFQGNPNFTSFDQNWNGHQYCEYIVHDYNFLLGWLRPKYLTTSPSSSVSASISPSASISTSVSPSSSLSSSISPSGSASPSEHPSTTQSVSPSPSQPVPPTDSWLVKFLKAIIDWLQKHGL